MSAHRHAPAPRTRLEQPSRIYELCGRLPNPSASFVRLRRAKRRLRGGHPLEPECLRETKSEVVCRDPVAAHYGLREWLRRLPFRQEAFAGQSGDWPLRGLANVSMRRRHRGPGDDARRAPVHAQRCARTQDISPPEQVIPSRYAVAVDSSRLLLLAVYS
jgi:hypothetical protein